MNCPNCKGHTSVNYTATAPNGMSTYRRRICKTCGWVGFTAEKLLQEKDGRQQLNATKTERLHQREGEGHGKD